MTICNCETIKPHCILLMYKDINTLVPTPSFVRKKSLSSLHRINRNKMNGCDNRYDYNKVKYYFTNIFLRIHKEKMQESFYIINMLRSNHKIDNCNSLDYKYVYDKDGNLSICLFYNNHKDEDEDVEEYDVSNTNKDGYEEDNSNAEDEDKDNKSELYYYSNGEDDGYLNSNDSDDTLHIYYLSSNNSELMDEHHYNNRYYHSDTNSDADTELMEDECNDGISDTDTELMDDDDDKI